ncbi:PPE family protein, partial [Mycobacterium tuberculosis]
MRTPRRVGSPRPKTAQPCTDLAEDQTG